jgi:hypothetical protein
MSASMPPAASGLTVTPNRTSIFTSSPDRSFVSSRVPIRFQTSAGAYDTGFDWL